MAYIIGENMIEVKTLNSGTRVIVENKRGVEGVSFRMHFSIGSKDETPEIYGISHLIEHMLFKGTKKRSAFQISYDLERVGASVNAFTSKQSTCYLTYGTKDSLKTCVEVLSDMFFNSVFDEIELEKEKQVVLEEMKMYQDTPRDVAETLIEQCFFDGTPYSHDIIGTEKSVLSITREQILEYIKKYYTPKNLVVSFAGNITLEKALKLVEEYIESGFKVKEKSEFLPNTVDFMPKRKEIKKYMQTNQSHVLIAFPVENIFKQTPLSTYCSRSLCNGMSSRLFQIIREKLGLVYSIFSGVYSYEIGGLFIIQFATSSKNVPLALKTIRKELNKIVLKGFKNSEFKSVKKTLIANLKLNTDNLRSASSKNINSLLYLNKIETKEDRLKKYNDVKLEEVNAYAKSLFSKENYVVCLVGENTEYNLLELFK